jgi:hypothetical protein
VTRARPRPRSRVLDLLDAHHADFEPGATPEHDLLIAVLRRALLDLQKPKHRNSALEFFVNAQAGQEEVYGSFPFICYQVSPLPERLMDRILTHVAGVVGH